MSTTVGTMAAGGTTCRPHNKPENYREVRDGNTIKVYCRVCGGWIGNRPANDSRQGATKQ